MSSSYDFTDDDFKTAQPLPGGRAMGTAAVAPQAAVDGLKNGPGAGVPPALAMHDPVQVNDAARLSDQTGILKTSPAVRQWVQGDAAKVAATQDDFPFLASIGQGVKDFIAPISGALSQTAIDAKRYYSSLSATDRDKALGSLVEDITSVPFSPIAGAVNVLARPVSVYGPQAYQPGTERKLSQSETQSAVTGAILTAGMGLGATGDLAEAFLHTPEGFPRAAPDTTYAHPVTPEGMVSDPEGNPLSFKTQKEAAQWILKKGYENPANPQIFDIATNEGEGYGVKQTGLTHIPSQLPVVGADAATDSIRVAQAELDAQRVKDLQSEIEGSKTQSRLPALTQEFIDQNVDHSVYLSPEHLVDLYKAEDKSVGPDDGILGHIEGFSQQLQDAIETGQDIRLSLGEYLSSTAGKPWADALLQGTRLRAEGVSQDEGKELGEAPEVKLGTTTPPTDFTPEERDRALALAQSVAGAIQENVKGRYLKQLFEDQTAAGMTKDQFNRYSAKIEQAQEAAHIDLMERAYAQIRRERKPDWQERFAQHKAEIEQGFFARPDIQAMHYLKYGEHPDGAPLEGAFKLDKASVEKSYPDSLTSRLPSGIFGKNGVEADDAASLFGYESGHSMLQDLAQLEDAQRAAGIASPRDYLKKVVAAQAHRATGEELGFDLTPENLAAAASDAVTAPSAESLLTDELRSLAKQSGEPFVKEDIEAKAAEFFDKLPVKGALQIKEFERVLGRLGRQAEIALLKGDVRAAFKFKQQQLLNQHMLRMSHDLVKDFAKTQAKFAGWARTPASKNIAQDWMNQVHNELKKLGYAVRRDPAELEEQLGGETLGEFIDRKSEAGSVIAGEGDWSYPQKGLKDLPVSEYENARDTLSSLIHNGRIDAGVVILGRRAAFNDLIERVKANGDALGRKLTPERLERLGLSASIARTARSLNAPMIRPEQLVDEMDRNDPEGPLNQAVIYPLQEAKGWENDELTRLTSELKTFAKKQPKAWLGSLEAKLDPVESAKLRWTNPRTGTSELVFQTRGNMIRAMLNMGNKSNLSKLLEGYGWEANALNSFLARNATKADWDFVQHWWDAHESLWPRIASTYRNLSGVAPKRIVPQPVSTPHGEYKGGYFPVTYDKLRAPEVKTLSSDSIWGEDYQSSLPANGYTKGRTGYVAPVALHFDGLNSSLGQIIHDLAFREALQQANRVLSNNDVRAAIQDNLGPSYTAQLRPWLEYTARERVFDDRAASGIVGIIRGLRTNLTFLGLGYRASSVLIHADVALSDSIAEVGAADFAKAVGRLWQTPAQRAYWLKYVTDNSPEIRNRLINMDSNIREAVMKLAEKQGFLSEVQHYGFHALGISDNLSAIPTWMAAAEQEIAKGRSPEQAFQIADKRVRQAHGSSAPVDLPAMQRGGHGAWGEAGRTAFGMFLSFMNHNYNRIWGIGRQFGRAGEEAKAGDFAGATRDFTSAAARSFWYVVIPAITVSAIKNYEHTGSLIPKTLTAWADGVAHASFGGYPGVGELISSLEKGDPGANPVQHALIDQAATIHNAFNESKKILGKPHKNVSKRWLQQAVGTAGIYVQGVPGQAGTTGQYLWDFATGHEHAKDFNDFLRGVLFGPKPKGKK